MPGKIKVKVLAGRNLPVMDRASDTTDAFVEIKFGGVTHKTDVCRKSLNPHWSSTEWYRFEVDESELQDEPLQLRLMDHDTYSANDAIGKVVISLAPLLAREANNAKGTTGPPGGAVLSGWIPVFDTMHGIRGELNVIVKVELFSDFNKYKTSSCGVQFFHCPMIPPGYKASSIHGFVEELVVNDDPEYQWIDKIRTPRASNEARQVAFIKLSNQVQRLVGLKAAELGANAVVGYQQEFDLEGEAGVVARAIGTAVSITPLPMPSQPLNTISCTQQQLKKCLDILATDDESVTDINQYYKNHQEELQKMINILNPKGLSMLDSQENENYDDDKVELVRQSSLNSYAGSASLYQYDYASRNSLRHLSEDQTDLNRLLNRKTDDDSDSSGPIQKIKKLKTNFFTKRFTKRKGDRKADEKQDDTISLKSNSSDTSRITLYDIKNELKKFKRLKKPKFRKALNKEDEGEGMASILARSVIHARTTLQVIAEMQDSQAENSPCSTLRRTSEFDPNVNSDEVKTRKISEHEKDETADKKVPEIQFSSLKNISSDDMPKHEPRVRRISESCPTSPMAGRSDNLLKLPGDIGYFGSVSSALSGESSIYSTSEDGEDSSDLKTDTDDAFETTSSIVKSVMKYESDPAFISQKDRKLTVLQNNPPKISESVPENLDTRATRSMEVDSEQIEANRALEKATNEFECKIEQAENVEKIEPSVSANEPSTSMKDEKCVPKPNTNYIKIHNPFAHRKTSTSISCPSSPVEKHNFVYRSSKRIKDKLSKISKNNMIKSISHISLFPKKKEVKTLSHPGSSSDVPSFSSRCPSETVLGSHFLSYSDLLGLDKERMQTSKLCKSDEIGRSKFSMYIGSEPVSRCSFSGPCHPQNRDEQNHKKEMRKHSLKRTGLIHTAMETMLIDKIESLLIPTSPEPVVNSKFFDDVSEKLEEHKNSGAAMRQLQSTTGSTTPRIVAVTPKRLSEDLTANIDKFIEKKHQEETKGLFNTVMLPDNESVHASNLLNEEFDSEKERAMHKKKDSRGSISTLMDKVHFHPYFFHHKKDGSSHDIKSGGLIHAAMQTILIDRAQSMIPDTPEPIPIHTEPDFGEIGKHKHQHFEKEHNHKDKQSKGLVHSALQTMLIDNVQSVLPDSDKPVPIRTEPDFGEEPHKNHGNTKEKESTGLVHSALQTMLIDNVQSVLPDSDEPVPIRTEPIFDDTKSQKSYGKEKESTGLVHSALQTMLIDNVQSVLPDSDEPVPIRTEPIFDDTKSQKNYGKEKESTGLIHSALQTMLIDNVQSVLPDSDEPVPIRTEPIFDDTKSQKSYGKEKESTGLVHSALQTMLIDNVQSVLPDSDEPVPIRTEPIFDDTKSQKSYGKEKESTGLVHSALQTMLIDNVQSVLPDSDEPVPIRTEPIFDDTKSQNSYGKEKKSTGLVHSALQTMLIDNVQSVLLETSQPIPSHPDSEKENVRGDDIKSVGLVHSAMETMLLDKAHPLINPEAINIQSVSERTDTDVDNETREDNKDDEDKGLVHTAMETMLIDRMQTMFHKAIDIDNKESQVNKIEDKDTELKSIGLVQDAMLTINKVQSLVGPEDLPSGRNVSVNTKKETSKPVAANSDVVGTATKPILIDKAAVFAVTTKAVLGESKAEESNVKRKEDGLVSKGLSDDWKYDISEPKKEAEPSQEEISKQKETEYNIKDISTHKEIDDKQMAFEKRKKHFTRQDSIHSVTSTKMSNEPNAPKVTKALLQHFHPLLSGGLETIPSVEYNEDSFDRSIDETGCASLCNTGEAVPFEDSIGRSNETNSASVCDNSHAACRFDREREKEKDRDRSEKGSPRHARHESCGGREPGGEKALNSSLNASSTPMGIHRRSSDSDLSVTPKGGSLNTSAVNVGSGGGAILRPSMNSNNLDMLEYPFLTMTEYPPGFIVHIGGAVCARSVKLVDGGGESAARAAWWAELRTELRAHARALRCNAVIAYRDTAAICEDVCVLSASGTAVVINLDCDFNADIEPTLTVSSVLKAPVEENESDLCSIAHVPYSPGCGPYRAELTTCGVCRRARVPAVLLAACAKPNKLEAYPKSVTLTAAAARIRRAPPSAEPAARDISDQLPFLEYELHKLLLAKLRMQGANALFSLQTQIAIGERCVMALASGQAVKLTALPPPTPPRIKASEKEKDALEMQKALWDTFTANKVANGYDVAGLLDHATNGALPEVEKEEQPVLDLCADKDACVLELDEAEDVETARALSKRRNHMQAFTNSLKPAAGAQPLAFTQVSRARLVLSSGVLAAAAAERQVARALDGAAYKLRRLAPAALNAAFHLELPEDEIQLVVSGTAIPLADPSKPEPSENGHSQSHSQSHSQTSSQHSQNNSQSSQNHSQTDDDIFELDEEQMKPVLTAQEMVEDKSAVNGQVGSAVSLTTLSQVGVGRRARRLCALRLLFVRETTAVRELGGLSGFLHTFTCEVLAILRAYTAALGGNALTSFYITQLMLQDNAHKNQGQCLLSVGGDVVHVSY